MCKHVSYALIQTPFFFQRRISLKRQNITPGSQTQEFPKNSQEKDATLRTRYSVFTLMSSHSQTILKEAVLADFSVFFSLQDI